MMFARQSVKAFKAPRGARGIVIKPNELPPVLRRAMLYVPGSNQRMLEKSLASPADSVSYDLEDAVAPAQKPEARKLIANLLNSGKRPKGEVMIRINAVGTGFENEDIAAALSTWNVEAIALPKTNSADHVRWLVQRINELAPPEGRTGGSKPIRIIGMIESAEAMVNINEIAAAGNGHLDSLLFAAEDYCADLGITRTPSLQELLYHRSKLVTSAKAFGLGAIDLVCVNFKDPQVLARECEDGHRLGFTGKQAIHPNQIEEIQRAYAPSEAAVRKAARVKFSFELNDKAGKGAYALDGAMIDAPVYKQALKVLSLAEAAGLPIPEITEKDIQ